jgi:acyl dehydratase
LTYKTYLEDFKLGEIQPLGQRVVDKQEVIDFATRFDPQPFHTDEAAAKDSIFGGLIASGWHTCSMVMRMMCDTYLTEAASLGSPGIDNVRWLKPVRPGDTIRAQRITLEVKPSSSKPDRGIVKSRWEVFNQKDELVMTMEGLGMFKRRNPAS